jgi:hypothetical protein
MSTTLKTWKNPSNGSMHHRRNDDRVCVLSLGSTQKMWTRLTLLVEIPYNPKENSFQNAFLKFLAGEKSSSLEAFAQEPILRKPKDNVYIGAVNSGIMLSSLGQPTGSMGYQTYTINDEARMEEIMVIGRPMYDDSKGVKINPLLKNLPNNTNNNQTNAFLSQAITLTSNAQHQKNSQQQQHYINTLNGLFQNASTDVNLLQNAVRRMSWRCCYCPCSFRQR